VFSSFALGHSTAAVSWDDREVRRRLPFLRGRCRTAYAVFR
jgi:hypothetical protein